VRRSLLPLLRPRAGELRNSFTREWSWTFAVTSQPTEGHLTLDVVDLGPIGAEVTLNGARVMTPPPPLGDGSATGSIPGSAFRIGSNELPIRPNAERSDLIEDFQLDQLRLVMAGPRPWASPIVAGSTPCRIVLDATVAGELLLVDGGVSKPAACLRIAAIDRSSG
jgi:hypothetical protein